MIEKMSDEERRMVCVQGAAAAKALRIIDAHEADRALHIEERRAWQAQEQAFQDDRAALVKELEEARAKAESWERGHDYWFSESRKHEAEVARLTEELTKEKQLSASMSEELAGIHDGGLSRDLEAAEQKLAAEEERNALVQVLMADKLVAVEDRGRELEQVRDHLRSEVLAHRQAHRETSAELERAESELAQLRERVAKAIRESGPPNATWDVAGPRMLEALRGPK